MPFYEYKCDTCGHQFEVMQRISAEPLKECEACGAAVRRIIFPSAIVYKGSGFYSTEYGRSRFNHPTSGKKEEGGASSSGDSSSSTGDSASSSSASESSSSTSKSSPETKSTKSTSSSTSKSSTQSASSAS